MRDDDLEFDLSAWEAPAPPAGIADAVVERMREAVAASPMTHLIQTVPSRRRWWIAGGAIGLAGAAALAILLFGGKRPDEAGHGSVVATRAQHLELGDVVGELDPGVELTWDRDGSGLRVVQRRGNVTWRVPGDDHLVIDAGAAVASVEASGASLRVEVQMNQSDARLIGVSGVTAAAVALVTVVVYEGHIKAGSGGQPTVVAAGDTWKSGSDQSLVGVSVPTPAPGAANVAIQCMQAKADKKWVDLEGCSRRLEPLDAAAARDFSAIAVSEMKAEVALGQLKDAVEAHDVDVAHDRADQIPATSVYKADADRLIASLGGFCDAETLRTKATEFVNMGQYGAALQLFDKALKCDPSSLPIKRLAFLAACQAGNDARARELYALLPVAQQNGLVQICLRNHINPAVQATSCDADNLRKRGIEADDKGDYSGALEAFEASIQCKHDDTVVLRAYFAACNGRNAGKAREHFDSLSSWDQVIVAPYCTPVVPLHPRATNVDTCIPATLTMLGSAYINQGQYRAALPELKRALQCTGGDTLSTTRLAYLAACQVGDASTARTFFQKFPAAQRGSLAQICLRNNIDPAKKGPVTPNNAVDASTLPAAKCDVDELRTRGTELVNKGEYGAALNKFKEAMKCPGGDNLAIIRLAFLSACQAGDAQSAKSLFALIPPNQQNGVQMICMRNHIEVGP